MFLPYLVRNNKYRVIPYTHQSHAEWILENKEADLRNMAILRSKNEEQSKNYTQLLFFLINITIVFNDGFELTEVAF